MIHRHSMHVMRSIVSIVTILTMMVTPALRVQTVNAAGSQHLMAFTRENWVRLIGFPANTDVVLTVVIPDQDPYQTTVHTDENGDYWESFQEDGDPVLADGMTIQATVPGSDPLVEQVLVLAPFSIDAVDYAGRVIQGTGPDSSTIHVYLNRANGSDDLTVATQSDGSWSLIVPQETSFAAGAQKISAQAFDSDGDAIHTDLRLPQMAVGIASDWIYLFNYPSNDTVTITIEDGIEIFFNQTFQVNEDGFLEIPPAEHQQDLIPGMTVTALGQTYSIQKSVSLPDVAITAIDNETKTVSGTAVEDLDLVVSVNYSDDDRVSLPVTTIDGNWSANFSAFEGVDRIFNWPDLIDVYVEYYNNSTDWVYVRMPKPATIQASPVYDWIQGQNFRGDSGVSLTIKDSNNLIVFGPQNFPVEPWGGFFIDRYSVDGEFNLEPGMVVSVDGGSAGAKDLTLQALTLDSADLETGEIRGTAPSGSLVNIFAGNDQGGRQIDTTAGPSNEWLVDFTPGGADDFELLPDMRFDAALPDEDGDQTVAELTSAHIDVWLESNSVSAYDWPVGQAVNLTVFSSDGQIYYSASQMPQEFWDNPGLGSADFFLDGEHSLQPGQKVIVQSGHIVRRTTVQNLGAIEVDLNADTISGTAAPGAMIWGCVFTESGCIFRETTAGQDGVFSLDYFGGDEPYDLKPGDEGVVNWSDGQGNNNARFWRMWQGFIAANVQNRWVNFRDWPQFESVTLKINGNAVSSTTVDQNPWNPGDPNDVLALFENVDFQAGDELGIYDDEDVLIRSLTVGAIDVTAIDLANDLVSGTATTGATVEVCVNTDYGCEFRRVQASDGNWAADFSVADSEQGENAIDLVLGSNGWAAVYDEDGDQTMRDWHMQEPNITANVQHSWVQSRNWPSGTQVVLTVEDTPFGTVEAGPADWNPDDIVAIFEGVSMQAGQTVSVSNLDDSITQSLQVANLAITEIDREYATITGTTDPNLWLEVCISTMDGCLTRFVQADGSGNWTADFATEGVEKGDFGLIGSIAPGSEGWVAANEADGPDRTWLDWSLPGLPGFQASLTNNWINGWNFSPNISNLNVTVENQSHEVVYASGSVTVDEGGNFWIDSNFLNVNLLPEMIITVLDPNLGEKTLTLMPLSLDLVDLETDVIAGTAPIGSELIVNAGNEFGGRDVTVFADDQGVWSADFAAANFDLLPHMGFNVSLQDEDGDRTFAELTNAHINVWLDENRISGYEWEIGQGNQVTLLLQDSEGETLFEDSQVVQADDQGEGLGFVDFFVPADMPLQPGEKVILSSGNVVRRMTIADLPAPTIDLETSTLTIDYSIPGASIWSCVNTQEGCIFRKGTFDEAAGNYVIDYQTAGEGETPYQLQPGDQGGINLDDGQNNQTSRNWKIWNPNITASVAGQWVHAREWAPGTQVTLSINDGELIGPVTVQGAEWNEEDIVGVFQLEEGTISVGDVLTVTDGVTTKTLTLVDLTVNWSDRADAILRGSTAAGMRIEVGINRDESEGGVLVRQVSADENTGNWAAEFSEPGAQPGDIGTAGFIWDGAYGWVTVIDEDGDRTQLDWAIPNPHMDVWINNNFISVYDWPIGSDLALTVTEGGTEIYTATGTMDNESVELAGSDEHPLAAGQTVTISGGGFARSLTLADLQAPIVDMANSTLSGQAEPGAFIWACVFAGDEGCVWRGMEAGPDGAYLLDFDEGGPDEAIHVFQPGDHGGINWAGEQGNNTSRFWSVGRYTLLAIPSENQIAGLDWPEDANVTVTVTDPQTSASRSGSVVVMGEDECGDRTCFTWEPVDWTLAAGQVVTASDGTVTKAITISALQITRVDVLHDQLTGTANPNEEVLVSLVSQSWITRKTMADSDGYWMVDFSVPGNSEETTTADLTVPDSGIVQQVDAASQTGDGTHENWFSASPIVLSSDHLDENVLADTTVGSFSPVYDLEGQTLAYSLVEGEGDADNGAFTIEGDALKINASPNYEIQSSYSIRIRVEDSGAPGKSFETPMTITVNDLSDAPSAIDLSATTIQENVGAGTVIGTLSAADEDHPAQEITYSLVDGYEDNSAFTITNGDQLAINQSPDYEIQSSYAIKVRATDSQGATFDQTFTIEVEDVGEAPTDILLSSASVDENVPANTVVGMLSVFGAGQDQTFGYSLVSGAGSTDNASFTIDGNSLKINASPNFEQQSTYAIRVRATDSQDTSLIFEKALTITVNDLNEAPSALNLSATSLNENVPSGSAVGTFSASDPDTGQAFAYSLVSGSGDDDNDVFTITGTALTINASPNYEVQSSYSIRVRVTDNGTPAEFFERNFTITINDVNEAPTALNLSATSLNENAAAGSTVGNFSASDPDSDQAFTYSLVSGSGDTDNSAFTLSGASLTIIASPNFEAKASYDIRVRVTDSGDPAQSLEKNFTITVIDLNEQPTAIDLTSAAIAENSLAGSAVGSFVATDPDAGQSFTYSLVSGTGSDDNAAFAISGSTLTIKAAPDYETKSSYTIRVRATDNGSPSRSFEQPLTVTVENVEEAPIVVNFSKTGLQDSLIAFTDADFSTHFIDPDSSGLTSLQRIKISGLPAHGVLRMDDGPALSVDAEVLAADLNHLVYQPDAGYSGSDSFSWNGSDSVGYAVDPAQVALTIGFVANYGLQVSPAGDAKSIKAETSQAVVASYALTVTNTGNIADSYLVTLVGTPGWATTFSPAEIANLPVGGQGNVSVQVTVPAGASGSQVSTLNIASVSDPSASVTVTLTTTASAPPPPSPVLLSISPASVNVAVLSTAKVTLSGANFSDPMTVKIGGVVSPSVVRNSSAELVAAVPTSLTPNTYTVQVCNASAKCASLPDAFTVLNNDPLISSVYPAQGYNDAPNGIFVRGFNLGASTTLSLSGAAADKQPTDVRVNGSQLQATIPAGLPAGSYDLMACNGSACDTLEGAYTALDVVMNDFSASNEDLWTAPITIREGNTVVLGLNVHRLSGIGLASAPVAFYINDPSDPANKISPASDPQTAEMLVGSADVVTAVWTPTGLSGTVRIYAVIDPQGLLTEATRANNTVSTTIQILPRQEEDEIAPMIDGLHINGGEEITGQKQVDLTLTANDNPSGVGVKTMKVVERQYNTSARQWVVAQESGWIAYQASYTMTLTEQAGLHYVQVWVADGAGNMSEMAQASINYAPIQEAISAGQVHIYRLSLTAGEEENFSLESLTGDADLYVWDEDGNLVASSLETDPMDAVSFTAAASGNYQVEVYGYTDATYTIDFTAALPELDEMATDRMQNDLQAKPIRSQPSIITQNEPLRNNPSESAPIDAETEGFLVFLPIVIR